MRALCAAIMTAGALIGLGLTALGLGTRYAGMGADSPAKTFIRFSYLDTPMMLILIVLLVAAVAGIGAVFLGLAYHHERRQFERQAIKGERVGDRFGE